MTAPRPGSDERCAVCNSVEAAHTPKNRIHTFVPKDAPPAAVAPAREEAMVTVWPPEEKTGTTPSPKVKITPERARYYCKDCGGVFDTSDHSHDAPPAAAAPQGERLDKMSDEEFEKIVAYLEFETPIEMEFVNEARRTRQSEHDLTVLGIKRENQLIDLRRSEAALAEALEEIAKNGSPTWAQERAKRALSALKQRGGR